MKRIVLILFALGVFIVNAQELVVKFKSEYQSVYKNAVEEQRFNSVALNSLSRNNHLMSIVKSGNIREGQTFVIDFEVAPGVKEYLNTGLFEYVEPVKYGYGMTFEKDSVFPNDPYFSRQYGLYNDSTFSLGDVKFDADIDMELAWAIEQGDSNIVVAVMDAGLKMDHPEFKNRLWQNSNEGSDSTIDADNNGYNGDFHGWDFVNADNDPTDDHGHGTGVTSVIASEANNEIGYAGVDWNCKVMVCKILDENNSGKYHQWAEAIYYAVDNGAHVLNMSVGGRSESDVLEEAIEYAYDKGVTVVVSIGNRNDSVPRWPCGYATTIAVGSTDPDDTRSLPFFWDDSSGSNYGDHIDVMAPGHYIYTSSYSSNTKFTSYWGGTSQAAPVVTGLVSLLLAQDSTRTPDEIRSILRNSAEDQVGDPSEDVEGFDIYYGYGRVNAERALLGISKDVEEIVLKEGSMIYPNPVRGVFYLKEPVSTIRLYDVNGRLLLEQANVQQVSLQSIHKGLIVVELKEEEGREYYKLFNQ